MPDHNDRSLLDLEWPSLCALIAARTQSRLGHARALELSPAPDQATAELRQGVMKELLELALAGVHLPSRMLEDTSDATARLERGGTASQDELAAVRRMLEVAVGLTRFGESQRLRAEQVARILATSDELGPLLRELSSRLDEEGRVRDDASPALFRARGEVRTLRAEMKKRVDELIRRYREALQDSYFAERDGRYVLPVRADAPFRVEGIVLGTSASGSTLYVEPRELGQLGNLLSLAESEVERQVAIVLAELSSLLRPFAEELRWAQEVAVRADLLAACTRFSVDVSARVVPFGAPGTLSLKSARHPLLCARGVEVVPSDLRVSPRRGLVLSGPNAGGKTVALKTLGLSALLQSTGLPIPAADGSEAGFFDEVLCDIGDDQSLTMSLSTFSGHLKRVKEILEDASDGTLVLFDELMGGTDPDEGAVLAIATLDELVAAGAAVCVTTHYEPLKAHAAVVDHLENGAVGFDFAMMEPTFVVDMGRPGASSALIVAEKLGLPRHLTQKAQALLPEVVAVKRQETLDAEQIAAELRAETRKLEALRTEQQELNRKLAHELEKLKEQRRRQLEQEGSELQTEIRLARAELRTIRKDLGKHKIAVLRTLESQIDEVASLTRAGGKIQQALSDGRAGSDDGALKHHLGQLRPGARVIVQGFEQSAEVLEKPVKGQVRVLMGVMKMTVPLAQLSPVAPRQQKSAPAKTKQLPPPRRAAADEEPTTAPPVRSLDVTLDLRGCRVEESMEMVDRFVDDLLKRGEHGGYVLHGHGTGALKEAVRAHLSLHRCIGYSRPADRAEGGDAFTLFWLGS